MSFANAVCPPHAWDAFSTGFMSQIKPQVEFKINLKCVEPSGSRGYSLRMETRSVQRQIKDALKEKKAHSVEAGGALQGQRQRRLKVGPPPVQQIQPYQNPYPQQRRGY